MGEGRGTARAGRIAVAVACLAGAGAAMSAPPPRGGTISIEARTADGEYDPAMPAFTAAAADALTADGFTVLGDTGHAAYVLELVLARRDVGTSLAKVRGQGSPLVSGGVIVPLSTGKSDLVGIQRIRLEMRIRRRGDTAVAWRGTALTVRETDRRTGIAPHAASDLSAALLGNYPIQPTGVVGVP